MRANVWELPLTLKRRFPNGNVAAFAGGGPSFRLISAAGLLRQWRTGPIVSGEQVDYTIRESDLRPDVSNAVGLTGSGGIDFKLGPVTIAPEFRYTRWLARAWDYQGSRGYSNSARLNQIEFLTGIRF
jgi:hypothetical protein